MDDSTRTLLSDIRDKQAQTPAYHALMEMTEHPVDWAYEAWDGLLSDLSHKDGHTRAIAAQLLCNLAKSDPDKRIIRDFDILFNVTRDKGFVTARHCMQSLWKIGVVGAEHQKVLIDNLANRFKVCLTEKNGTLIRSDILQSMRNVYDEVGDDSIRTLALSLIETEEDPKYRKKYTTVWKVK